MEQRQVTKIFESLSSGIRLDILRLLIQYAPEGLVAGEISSRLNIPPNNLSFHLKNLANVSLISVEQEGRYQRCRANVETMRAASDHILGECCLYSKCKK